MQFLYVLSLVERYHDMANWNEETNKIMERHWNYLVGLHAEDVMQFVGRTDYQPGHKDLTGLAVFSAADRDKAIEIMNNDPCVKEGVMTATLHPFRLALIEGRKPES